VKPPPHPSFAGLEETDWDDTSSILASCRPVFDAFAREPGLLPALLDNLSGDEHLQSMCERYDFLDKLVLHDIATAGVRVRLHLYRPGYYDRPHNHRWSFASHILRGRYLHRIFGADHEFGEDTNPDSLQAIHERFEGAGATYALHHTSVHTVQADADTISLLLRGPAAKDRFLILDRGTGGSFWVYGADRESPEQRASKRMTEADLTHAISRVRSLTTPRVRTAATETP
jgi:hypothetical protein